MSSVLSILYSEHPLSLHSQLLRDEPTSQPTDRPHSYIFDIFNKLWKPAKDYIYSTHRTPIYKMGWKNHREWVIASELWRKNSVSSLYPWYHGEWKDEEGINRILWRFAEAIRFLYWNTNFKDYFNWNL